MDLGATFCTNILALEAGYRGLDRGCLYITLLNSTPF
jgi:hypothetical protein